MRLAKRYYAKLYREYAIVDLSRYKVSLLPATHVWRMYISKRSTDSSTFLVLFLAQEQQAVPWCPRHGESACEVLRMLSRVHTPNMR